MKMISWGTRQILRLTRTVLWWQWAFTPHAQTVWCSLLYSCKVLKGQHSFSTIVLDSQQPHGQRAGKDNSAWLERDNQHMHSPFLRHTENVKGCCSHSQVSMLGSHANTDVLSLCPQTTVPMTHIPVLTKAQYPGVSWKSPSSLAATICCLPMPRNPVCSTKLLTDCTSLRHEPPAPTHTSSL